MALPVANFRAVVNGNNASFTSLAETDTPIIEALWEFGDAGTSDSLDTEVSKTYLTPGIFIVKYTVTNTTGTSFTSQTILISEAPNLGVTIQQMVNCRIPFPDSSCSARLIRKWQLYLANGPYPPIPTENIFLEDQWPSGFNVLISELVSLELLVDTFTKFSLEGAQLSLEQAAKIISESQSSSNEQSNSQKGSLKRLETGPSVAEWYNPMDGSSVESGAKLLMSYFNQRDGIIKEYKMMICFWARRLEVYLPEICGVSIIPTLPIIAKR